MLAPDVRPEKYAPGGQLIVTTPPGLSFPSTGKLWNSAVVVLLVAVAVLTPIHIHALSVVRLTIRAPWIPLPLEIETGTDATDVSASMIEPDIGRNALFCPGMELSDQGFRIVRGFG